MSYNCVIDTATGYVKRAGFCDFANDGSFDSGTETHKTNVPYPMKIYGFENECHKWDGANFITEDVVAVAKVHKNAQIDLRTVELIQQGFTHSSETFSLSDRAQSKWQGAKIASDSSLLTFPLKVTTKDDTEYEIADAAELDTFFGAGVGTVQGHIDSGRALKLSVNAATDIAGVDAVTDNR